MLGRIPTIVKSKIPCIVAEQGLRLKAKLAGAKPYDSIYGFWCMAQLQYMTSLVFATSVGHSEAGLMREGFFRLNPQSADP
jgi:hypothetical protein